MAGRRGDPGEPAELRFTASAAATMRDAIRDAGGAEVFCVGRLDEDRRIGAVEVWCRGNEDSAPALLGAAEPGEAVIHNHPGGVLLPSGADLDVASSLGNLGVGFLIVDNEVERTYVVVEPMRPRERAHLGAEQAAGDLGPGGPLASSFPGYESREAQVAMTEAVARAFDRDGVALIEAGTGTGKSFAYLFPAVRFAQANRERVVVSTNTINLQSQLIDKDLPQVARALGVEVRATLLKGRTNYICRRKLEEALKEPGLFDGIRLEGDPGELSADAQLRVIAEYARTSEEGSIQGLGFVPHDDVWERIQSESDTTLRVKCPHYNECFFYGSRRRAAASDVVVANHHLLLSDLELREEVGFGASAILPPYKRLIVDEAHHLEDAATEHLAERLNRFSMAKVLARLVSPRQAGRGRIPVLISRIHDAVPDHSVDEARELAGHFQGAVLPAHREAAQLVDSTFDGLVGELERRLDVRLGATEWKRRLVEPFLSHPYVREVLKAAVEGLAVGLATYCDRLSDGLRRLERLPEDCLDRLAGPMVDVRASLRRVEAKVAALRSFSQAEDETCRWIEARRARNGARILTLAQAPVEVGARLRETMLDRMGTVVMTSATLRSGEDFEFLQGRLGMADGLGGRLETLAVDSPFDYDTQAFVGVPTDLPTPDSDSFPEALGEAVAEAVEISRGRAFILFTSYKLMNRLHDALVDRLRIFGFPVLKQGTEDRHRLLERFKREPGSVLFATSSFWEGVDVPGDALELVVLTRLPFAVPDEPILQARAERIEARGGDAFKDYSVPQAVLRFRQGFGRLIRTKTDRGAVLVMDRRVATQSYGRQFLEALPTRKVSKAPLKTVLAGMRKFFGRDRSPAPAGEGSETP